MKRMILLERSVLLTSIFLFSFGNRAGAAVLAYTGFDYSSGQLAGDLSTNDTGFSTDPWTGSLVTPIDTASSLIYPAGVSLSSQLGKISVTTTGASRDHHRSLTNSYSMDVDTDYYFSFLMKVNSDLTTTPQAVQFYTNLSGNDNLFEYSVGTNDKFRTIVYTPAPALVVEGGLVAVGETYFFVGKFSARATDPDIIKLQVYETGAGAQFPNVVGSEPTVWAFEGTKEITGSFDQLSIRSGVNAKLELDELRMGTTWADVTGASTIVVPGDYNADGGVNAADYVTWRDNYGTNFNLNNNGDESGASAGVVDDADYLWWRANFGGGSGSGSSSQGAVPEPRTWVLGLLVAGALVGYTARKLPQRTKRQINYA